MTADPVLLQLRGRVGDAVVANLRRSAEQGFLGSMPIEEQIDHALGFAVTVERTLGGQPSRAADLGTGGGIPGLVLHSCWPECRLVLMDGNLRRTEFLADIVRRWNGPGTLEVVRGRAEELARDVRYRHRFDVVTARSFGPPAVTAECGGPLLDMGGIMVVSEPPGRSDPRRWPIEGLAEVGLTPGSRDRLDDRFGYQVLVKSAGTPERYPRRVGVPTKRPLF